MVQLIYKSTKSQTHCQKNDAWWFHWVLGRQDYTTMVNPTVKVAVFRPSKSEVPLKQVVLICTNFMKNVNRFESMITLDYYHTTILINLITVGWRTWKLLCNSDATNSLVKFWIWISSCRSLSWLYFATGVRAHNMPTGRRGCERLILFHFQVNCSTQPLFSQLSDKTLVTLFSLM
jgi:hypothetical protein